MHKTKGFSVFSSSLYKASLVYLPTNDGKQIYQRIYEKRINLERDRLLKNIIDANKRNIYFYIAINNFEINYNIEVNIIKDICILAKAISIEREFQLNIYNEFDVLCDKDYKYVVTHKYL